MYVCVSKLYYSYETMLVSTLTRRSYSPVYSTLFQATVPHQGFKKVYTKLNNNRQKICKKIHENGTENVQW